MRPAWTGFAGIAMQAAIALCAFAGSEMASSIARMAELGSRERPEEVCMERGCLHYCIYRGLIADGRQIAIGEYDTRQYIAESL